MNSEKPTKKFIASLLRSEDIIPSTKSVGQTFYGWILAVNTPILEREQHTREINEAAFYYGDCEQIGFCSATYHLMKYDYIYKQLDFNYEVGI